MFIPRGRRWPHGFVRQVHHPLTATAFLAQPLPSDKDILGGAVFAFVMTDIRNNIAVRPPPPIPRLCPAPPFFFCFLQTRQGVRARYNAHKSVSDTLENLVQAEAREGGTQGTACLVRLTR